MGYKHKATDANPWGLTLAECNVMRELMRTGCTAAVARRFHVETKTVQRHLTTAMRKMGVRNRVLAVLAWDRRVREDHQFVGKRLGSIFAMAQAGVAL